MRAFPHEAATHMKQVQFKMHMEPGCGGVDWEVFKKTYPRFAVAIDGYSPGGVRRDDDKPIAAFDHHLIIKPGEKHLQIVDRLSMRATCAQIMMAVQRGFYTVFKDENGPRVEAYFKGCDEDDCFSRLLLEEPHLLTGQYHDRLVNLIDLAEKVDTMVGLYCPPGNSGQLKLFKALAWVTDPYGEFRKDKGPHRQNPQEHIDVMDQVIHRAKRYLNGTHRQIPLNTSFDTLNWGRGWIMIRENGRYGKLGATQKGHQAIVSCSELGDGKYSYIFTRVSDYIKYFDLPYFIQCLNEYEAERGNTTKLWGGSGDLVMGSPWNIGTDIPPEKMAVYIDKMISGENPFARGKLRQRLGNS